MDVIGDWIGSLVADPFHCSLPMWRHGIVDLRAYASTCQMITQGVAPRMPHIENVIDIDIVLMDCRKPEVALQIAKVKLRQ